MTVSTHQDEYQGKYFILWQHPSFFIEFSCPPPHSSWNQWPSWLCWWPTSQQANVFTFQSINPFPCHSFSMLLVTQVSPFQMCNEAILKCGECDCVMWTRLFTCRHQPNCTTERWQCVHPQCGFCCFQIKIVKTCNCSCHEHGILEWTLFNTNQCATRNISRSRIYHDQWVHWGLAWICNNKKAVFSIWVDGNVLIYSRIMTSNNDAPKWRWTRWGFQNDWKNQRLFKYPLKCKWITLLYAYVIIQTFKNDTCWTSWARAQSNKTLVVCFWIKWWTIKHTQITTLNVPNVPNERAKLIVRKRKNSRLDNKIQYYSNTVNNPCRIFVVKHALKQLVLLFLDK